MNPTLAIALDALAIGIGASLVMDLFILARKRLLGVPSLDYAMVGRWLGHIPRGRLRHTAIAAAAPIAGERALGWATHLAIGVAFAALLPALWGTDWLRTPTPGPALLIGLVTLAAPFLVLQPALGAGIAAARTPRPNIARLNSLTVHLAFGLGLYLAALAWSALRYG